MDGAAYAISPRGFAMDNKEIFTDGDDAHFDLLPERGRQCLIYLLLIRVAYLPMRVGMHIIFHFDGGLRYVARLAEEWPSLLL